MILKDDNWSIDLDCVLEKYDPTQIVVRIDYEHFGYIGVEFIHMSLEDILGPLGFRVHGQGLDRASGVSGEWVIDFRKGTEDGY